MKRSWEVKEPNLELSRKLSSELNIDPLVAKLLTVRGIDSVDSARWFLYCNLDNLHPPGLLKGMEQAVDRISSAIRNNERIWIYGDYDVDGVTAVSTLLIALRYLGLQPKYYIPHRVDEGYGLSIDSISELKQNGCDLIITVDCGISSFDEVEFAKDQGIDVIITDHHEPSQRTPSALAVINPKAVDDYPFKELSGVGVALKLVQALVERTKGGSKNFAFELLDLVALGTIADVVPLIGENRILVKYGLEMLNKAERPGIRALCEVAGLELGKINSYSVAYRLSPRINAIGRMDTATDAVELLVTDSYDDARWLAQRMDSANKERQNVEKIILDSVMSQIRSLDTENESCFVITGEDWHLGVIGIVAGKIADLYYKPTVLISLKDGIGHGSARSVPELDIFSALSECSELLMEFGGHKMAAGLTIEEKNVDKFRERLKRIIKDSFLPMTIHPKTYIDMKVTLNELTEPAVQQLSLLQPYGYDNPEPTFLLTNVASQGMRITSEDKHLQLYLSDGFTTMRAIAYNMALLKDRLEGRDIKIDAIVQPFINTWNGNRSVELKVRDVRIYDHDDPIFPHNDESLNITIVDRRNTADKMAYISSILSEDEPVLIYVRDDYAIEQLKKMINSSSIKVRYGICYSATSEQEEEELINTVMKGSLKTIISSYPITKRLPVLRHIIFCHPVLTQEEFIQCCMPAINAKSETCLHLLFNETDIAVLTKILRSKYPDRETLINVYKRIVDISGQTGTFLTSDLFNSVEFDQLDRYSVVVNSLKIFKEINLITHKEDGRLSLRDVTRRYDLNTSQLYQHGRSLIDEWTKFSDIIMKKPVEYFMHLIRSSLKKDGT